MKKPALIVAAAVALLAGCGSTSKTVVHKTIVVHQAPSVQKTITHVVAPAPSPPANPYADGRDCGNDVYAGPDTSCPFALNVQNAYFEAPGQSASVEVYSPVTGQNYVMNCGPAGTAITCSGGNGASVTFP